MSVRKTIGAIIIAGLTLATAAPSSADEQVFSDPTYDVRFYDWMSDTSSYSSDPNTDISSVGLTHDATDIFAGIFVREYNTLGIDFWSYEFSVDGVGEPDFSVGVLEDSEFMQVENAGGQVLSCNEVTVVSGNARGIGLDRSCFGNPQQLYIRVGVIDSNDSDPECCQDNWTDFAPNDLTRYYGPVGAASTSPNPTPTATATASPTSSPTASPTASPSASPTETAATPTPTASSSPPAPAHQVPSLSVSPFRVKFGQTANVTIHGTPGAVVDLYIRKYQGSFTKIRSGLVLDGSGQTVVATKPDMNLRFQAFDRTVAQGSSIGGSDGLMTVEKYISINVQRVSAGRYTFTGSINPTHPGASVNIYRNGALWRSGITVNSSRVYSYTANLPGGTHNFQVRTGTSGYNNASASPVRAVVVSSTTSTAMQTTASSPPARPADADCADFSSWSAAQTYYKKYYPYYGDVSGLDADRDGVACESLPGAP